jgi:hypothetical protein
MSGEFCIIWYKHETANIPDAGIVGNLILCLNLSFLTCGVRIKSGASIMTPNA